MKKKICKSSRLVLLFLLLALISGCGESHADTPEFSTSKDRNTGFVPKTFQQQHETENQKAEEISKQYKIPIRLTKRILYELQDIHLIFETIEEKKGDVRYLPGIDINKLTVGTLLEKLDSAGSEDFKVDRQQYSDSWKILEHARKEYMYNNSQILLKDL